MRTVPYKQVLQGASVRWTGEKDPSSQDADFLNALIHARAREYWESAWWPEWMGFEERQFRQSYASGSTYAAGSSAAAVEVYYPPAKRYYQSLHAGNTGNAPATLSGGDYVENSAHWAECRSCYSGEDWATGTTYTFSSGNPQIVRNPADDRYYQLITSHVAGATLDATKFGILTAFVRSIDLEQSWEGTKLGETRRVWPKDPRANPYWLRGKDISFEGQGGVIVVSGCQPKVWVEFRRRPFTWLYSAIWVSGPAYAPNQVVYDTATGEVYKSLDASNTNDLTDGATWEVQAFPYVLEQCVAQGAYADALRTEKDTEGYVTELAEAERLRQVAAGIADRQHREQMMVVGR